MAFDIVHREVGLPVVFAHLMDGDDVGIAQAGGGKGLIPKALDRSLCRKRAE